MTCLICLEENEYYIKLDSCECLQRVHKDCFENWIEKNHDKLRCIICKNYKNYEEETRFQDKLILKLATIIDFLFCKIYMISCFQPSSFFIMISYCFIITFLIVIPYIIFFKIFKFLTELGIFRIFGNKNKYSIIYK
jgi:hypothetical protein